MSTAAEVASEEEGVGVGGAHRLGDAILEPFVAEVTVADTEIAPETDLAASAEDQRTFRADLLQIGRAVVVVVEHVEGDARLPAAADGASEDPGGEEDLVAAAIAEVRCRVRFNRGYRGLVRAVGAI